MEKELPESKQEELIKENESPESSENRQEIAEKSDSFPPQKITNPPETNGAESETPPSEERGENKDEPSPLEGRVAELEQKLEQTETQRREGEEQLSTTQKALAEAVSRYRALLLASTPEAPESMVVGETVDEVDRSFAEAKALVQRVRRDVEEKLAKERLPAGSPTRGPANFSSLSSMEKIRAALSDQ